MTRGQKKQKDKRENQRRGGNDVTLLTVSEGDSYRSVSLIKQNVHIYRSSLCQASQPSPQWFQIICVWDFWMFCLLLWICLLKLDWLSWFWREHIGTAAASLDNHSSTANNMLAAHHVSATTRICLLCLVPLLVLSLPASASQTKTHPSSISDIYQKSSLKTPNNTC